MPIAPNSAMLMLPWTFFGGMPRLKLPDGRTIDQPHVEWYLHQLRWRWLLDSWEGGEVYRMAVYGWDIHGMPVRNLIRHKREYPSVYDQTYSPQVGRPPGTDPYNQATDDDYEMRRARTPVPGFVSEACEAHLSRIYAKEIKRQGPDHLDEWWRNVDGRGATMDHWMSSTIAPLLLVLGQLDIICDHPPVPAGERVNTRADERRLGLDSCIASYVLPENMIWWNLDRDGNYVECLVREVLDNQDVIWRYWDREIWAIYTKFGRPVDAAWDFGETDSRGAPVVHKGQQNKAEIKGTVHEHGFSEVPIVRIFDRRRPRMKNIGLPRYEGIAEIQREYYNRDSELILSDTTQAHPLLQGPEDYVQPDGSVQVGPNWLLPKKKNTMGGSASYEGFDIVEFPKGGADSIRENCDRLRDAADRAANLTKPAGAKGTTGTTVAMSGVSKRLDAVGGNDLLGKISEMLGRAEHQVARLADLVLKNGDPTEGLSDQIRIEYPRSFDLWTADELADLVNKFQVVLNMAGRAPETEYAMLTRIVRLALEGQEDEEYAKYDAELKAVLGQGPPAIPTGIDTLDVLTQTPNAKANQQATLLDPITRNPAELLG